MQIDYLNLTDDGKNVISCDKNASGRIIVPDGVEKVRYDAFLNCTDIFEIVLPQSLKELGSSSFRGCVNLRKVNIPNNIKEISSECFYGCIKLDSIKFPSNIKRIKSKSFYNCENLKEIIFPDSLENIEVEAFYGCSFIFQLEIPKNTYSISSGAFENCANLAILAIKSKNISISATAFKGCLRLTRLYLANFNTNLAISSFGDCVNLDIISPISDFDIIKSNNSVSYYQIHKEHANNLKYMCLYYKLLGMNLTQMKWNKSLKNEKSFKEPINFLWEDYKTKEQTLKEILALDWNYSAGIGLVLGYNNFRALDVDIDSDFMFQVMYPSGSIDDFIDEILDLLLLPRDYQWVVRSGNGYGFHIIFKCNDFTSTKGFDSISFAPSDKYDNYGQSLFKRIELRWCDHLVLPPSIHARGNNYYFRNREIPIGQPNELSLSLIDAMLCKYCGDVAIRSFTYKERSFKISELKKITSRHDSYLSPHEHNIDSIEYLAEISTPESINSLAIKYLIGEDVEVDSNKALQLFKSSNTQNSIFNLLGLYSVGFYQCTFLEFNKLLDTLDKEQFTDYISQLKENANKYIQKSDLFLFFDTETNGLPINYDSSPFEVNNWPRIIQIAWIITDDVGLIVKKANYIINPIGFTISPESTTIHGITNQYAKENGEDINLVLTEFVNDLNLCKYIIGHNIQFDKNVVTAEMCRLNRKIKWDTQNCICTMKSTIEYCKIPSKIWYHSGYSYPKLEELHTKLFGKSFENAHDAFSDITATSRCFWELKRIGFYNNYFKPKEDDDLPF